MRLLLELALLLALAGCMSKTLVVSIVVRDGGGGGFLLAPAPTSAQAHRQCGV